MREGGVKIYHNTREDSLEWLLCIIFNVDKKPVFNCFIGFSLTVSLLLYTKIHHNLMHTWRFSLSSNVQVQNIGDQKLFPKKC